MSNSLFSKKYIILLGFNKEEERKQRGKQQISVESTLPFPDLASKGRTLYHFLVGRELAKKEDSPKQNSGCVS